MSGRHAKPDRMWPPFASLALVAAGIPAAIVTGVGDAHSALAPAGIEQPDAPIAQAAAGTTSEAIDRAEQHAERWGWR